MTNYETGRMIGVDAVTGKVVTRIQMPNPLWGARSPPAFASAKNDDKFYIPSGRVGYGFGKDGDGKIKQFELRIPQIGADGDLL